MKLLARLARIRSLLSCPKAHLITIGTTDDSGKGVTDQWMARSPSFHVRVCDTFQNSAMAGRIT